MHSVCRCSLPVWRRSFLKKGTPRDLFLPRPPGSAPGWIWPKNNNTCKGPWVLHAYQVSSKSIKQFWRRRRKCEKFTPDGRRTDDDGRTTTDGRTDDGRCAMTIAHSSLRLRWAKNWRICPPVGRFTCMSRASKVDVTFRQLKLFEISLTVPFIVHYTHEDVTLKWAYLVL